jgi:hypothetical protein
MQSRVLVFLVCATPGAIAGCGSAADPPSVPQRLSASNSVADFGNVFQGTTQSAKLTVTNVSSSAMANKPLVLLEGAGDDLSFKSGCTHPLAPAESCDIEMTFAPGTPGAREGSLVIFDDGIDGALLDSWTRLGQPSRAARSVDLIVPVRGKGERRDKMSVGEATLDWGVLFTAPQPKTIHLTSVGLDPVKTAFMASGDADQFGFRSCPDELAPGEHCDLVVQPTPKRTGSLKARLDWGEGASCALTAKAEVGSLGSPHLVDSPTQATLRAVEGNEKRQVVVAGAGGLVYRRGGDNRWSQVVVPSGENLTAIATYGGQDYTYQDRHYRYAEDERDLIFAGSESGGIFLSRDGGAFAPLGTPGLAVASLRVSTFYSGPAGADNLFRPDLYATRVDGSQDRSTALEPGVAYGPAQTFGSPVVAHAYCYMNQHIVNAYVVADGSAYIGIEKEAAKKVDHPHAQGLRSVTCATSKDRLSSFVLVGAMGTVLSSPDGSAWNLEPSDTTNTLRWVGTIYDRGRIAVGDSGTIIVSLDGAPWRAEFAATKKALNAAAVLNDVSTVVAVGDDGTIVEMLIRYGGV